MRFDYCYKLVTYRRFGNLLVAVDHNVRDDGILMASIDLPQNSEGELGAKQSQLEKINEITIRR